MNGRRTIWKYQIVVGDAVDLGMPDGAEVLLLQMQGGVPCIWMVVDQDAPIVKRRFVWRGTGHPLGDVGRFIGTIQVGGGSLVFHLFEAATPSVGGGP